MKKYLLPESGNYYKANLHCHSNISDGTLSPQELKKHYMAKGYSVLAYTDHDVFIAHPELADENFLPLHGYEVEITERDDEKDISFYLKKCCHLCLVALEPDNRKQVCWHREKYLFPNAIDYKDQVQFDEEEPDYEREYTPECINDMIKRGRENGFFVTWAHPAWSLEEHDQYIRYEGMNAMEICNGVSVLEGFQEYVPWVYDEMLRAGKSLYCVGADDNHSPDGIGQSWIVIKADRLEYRTITKALEAGHFYASHGPEIKDLWVEDGYLCVTTSDAEQISFQTAYRYTGLKKAEEGEVLNFAKFPLGEDYGYVRVSVKDHRGNYANSNAYAISDIL